MASQFVELVFEEDEFGSDKQEDMADDFTEEIEEIKEKADLGQYDEIEYIILEVTVLMATFRPV